MVQFNDFIGNFLMGALMFIAIFGLLVTIQADNNAPNPLINNEIFGGENGTFNQLRVNINDIENKSAIQYESFTEEKPVPGIGSIVLFTIVGVGKTFGSLTIDTFAILIRLPVVVLGIDPSILAILTSWLAIVLIIVLWKTYKFGG